MPKQNNLCKILAFDLHAKQIENPLKDYARHILSIDKDEAEDSGVPIEKIFDEMFYDNQDIERDLEYLTTAGFIDRELNEGERTYSISKEAKRYLVDVRGWTKNYKDSMEETISREI